MPIEIYSKPKFVILQKRIFITVSFIFQHWDIEMNTFEQEILIWAVFGKSRDLLLCEFRLCRKSPLKPSSHFRTIQSSPIPSPLYQKQTKRHRHKARPKRLAQERIRKKFHKGMKQIPMLMPTRIGRRVPQPLRIARFGRFARFPRVAHGTSPKRPLRHDSHPGGRLGAAMSHHSPQVGRSGAGKDLPVTPLQHVMPCASIVW
mmetsp:Transcript_8465/g.18282  ORF Transcript_8465/g.18282 Transcript_8465/m.18282 type:complete len:203 (-) Transcript_8465:487-1095(-)